MKPRVWIKSLQFSDGSVISIEKDEIVVIVGPNNVGKSAALRDCVALLERFDFLTKVIKKIEIGTEGSLEDLVDFLEDSSTKNFAGNPEPHYQGYNFNVYKPAIGNHWNEKTETLGDLTRVFVDMLTTEERLQASNPPENIRLTTDPVRHPIHHLQKDGSVEAKLSEAFKQAFGSDLIVHRNAGNIVPLHVGESPSDAPLSLEFAKNVEALDLLHEQGDGMRSFVGVLLRALISHHSIHFIDEPEAFLHPPQARLLGKMLAKDIPTGKQMFLATHSEDFLNGLLDSNPATLRVIRIRRDGSINHVRALETSDIKAVWDDSLLRHSDVLKGLFHSRVVICESDSDCRFYSAILGAIAEKANSIAPDVLFIHCGGKHRMPTVVKALRELDVPVTVIADFDLLNDIKPLKEIFGDLGGDWGAVENDWKLVKVAVEQKKPELSADDVKKEMQLILAGIAGPTIPKEAVKKIRDVVSKTSAWGIAKQVGKTFIPNGDASQAFDRIQVLFKEKGLQVLEVGELEGFVKSVGNHGPKWVVEVLERDLKFDPELAPARTFVRQIFAEVQVGPDVPPTAVSEPGRT